MDIVLKARFRNQKHQFVVRTDDTVYMVRNELARAFGFPSYNVQMKNGFPPKEFAWNSKTKVQEVIKKNDMIVVQEGPSNMSFEACSDSEENENASSDSGMSQANKDNVGSISKNLWRIATFKEWGLQEGEWGRQFQVVWNNAPELSAEIIKTIEENRIRLKRLDSRSDFLKKILQEENLENRFADAKPITEILSLFFQMIFQYSNQTASDIAFIVASYCGAPEYLQTLSVSEQLKIHINEVVDKTPTLLEKQYAILSRQEMMDLILKNCAMRKVSLENGALFFGSLRERNPTALSDLEYIAWKLDFIKFLRDHELCEGPSEDLTKKQKIQLRILPLPGKENQEAEVSIWTCDCGWNNQTDDLKCYICQKPKPAEQISVEDIEEATSKDEPESKNVTFDDFLANFFATTSTTNTSSVISTSTSAQIDTSSSTTVNPPVQPTSTATSQAADDNYVVSFSQFVNAYVEKNLGSASMDRMRSDARTFYDNIKSDPETLLEAFQSFQ